MKTGAVMTATAAALVLALITCPLAADEPTLRATLRAQKQRITHIAFSPDGKSLVSSGWDPQARVWDLASGKSFTIPSRKLDPFAEFGADGGTVVVGGATNSEKLLYDVASGTGRTVRESPGTTLVGFSPDGKTEFLAQGRAQFAMRRLATAYDLSTGPSTIPLTGAVSAGLIQSWTFSPDGKTLVVRDKDMNLMMWDVAGGKCTATLAQTGGMWYAFGPDGKVLAASCASKSTAVFGSNARPLGVKLFEVASGRILGTLQESAGDPIQFVTFGRNGKTLASAGVYTIAIHEAATGKRTATLEKPAKAINPRLALSPDGKLVAAQCHDGTVKVWDVAGGRIVASLPGTTTQPAFSPDGKTLAFGCADGSVQLWDVAADR